jgi:hypothetical protein
MTQYFNHLLDSYRQLELSMNRQRISLLGYIGNVYNNLKWKAVNRFNYINYAFKLALLRSTKPQNPGYFSH